MKFELKTENEKFPKLYSNVFKSFFGLILIIIFCDVSLKIRTISRHYQIDYKCRLLSVEKSTSNFKKLSKLSKLKSKQKIWDFCREIIK